MSGHATHIVPKKRVAVTVIYDPSKPLDCTNVEFLLDVDTREPGDPGDHANLLAVLGETIARLSLYRADYWAAWAQDGTTRARA